MKAARSGIILYIFSLLLCGALISGSALMPVRALASPADIGLTQAEKDFIRQNPSIRLGVDPTFIPYEFIDFNGEYKGIAADYIDLICQKTGLTMTAAKGLSWSEAYEKAVERELDVLPCVSKTEEREQYFLFSDSYYTFQRVIFVDASNRTIKSFEDLTGKRVAVQVNSSHHGFLKTYDTLELSLYTTVEEALQAVSAGTETAFVGNLSTSSYLAKSLGITNLKYITIQTEKPQALYFAVRNDWPELVSIINKALKSIGKEDRNTINNKWIDIEQNADYSGIIRTVVIAGAIIALITAVSFFWIVRLRREIAIRKKTQEALKVAKEEAEQANQIKSSFLARMSHEIRTPLSAIMGMAYLMKKTEPTVTQGIYLDKLTQAARNMLDIINDILDFSKIESGKVELEKVSFDLDAVLKRVINIISVKVEEKGIDFAMEKAPDMPVFFIGDPVRIEQILLNLVNNAVKFTEKGGVSLSVQPDGKEGNLYQIAFSIRDTGIGMHKEQVDRLFIPFDQGDSSISRRFGGTGLGLSIVKSFTDLMGGKIEVHSVLHEGSTFIIRLPLEADESKSQIGIKKMAADCFCNIHALVLDESESVRSSLSNCFHSFGITASYASSQEDAMHLLRKASETNVPYNLLVIDYMTPKSGGIAFIARLKELSLIEPAAKCMLMIPMTREDLFDDIEAAGIEFGITKPIIPSILYNGIIEIFKITPPKPIKAAPKQEALVSPHPYHILLVEDNKTNQFIAKTIMEQAGFKVSKADNGEEGYTFFLENRPGVDLILMDLHMPVMDGYTATGLIRKIDPNISIVAMTADAISGVEEKCKQHGINRYVSKPFEPDQFITTILDILKARDEAKKESLPGETMKNDVQVLDAADGLKRIGGSDEVYRLILQEYYDENHATASTLQEMLQKGSHDEAVQVVHKLKSSSGNIGAKALFEAASELQTALKARDEANIAKWHHAFQSLMGRLLCEIENYLKA